MYKICVYGICKNEINNLDRWLKWASNADYICLLDTGSTDGTWEKLLSYQKNNPKLIIQQKIITPWRFDTARNESLKLIPQDTDIYFMADLDEETITDNWYDILQSTWTAQIKRVGFMYHRILNRSNKPVFSFWEYRIHSKGWHWTGIVHEQLQLEDGNYQLPNEQIVNTTIEVKHYQYDDNNEIMQKIEYYNTLLLQALKDDPTDSYAILHLIKAYAASVNKNILKIPDMFDQLLKNERQQHNLSDAEMACAYASLGIYYMYTYQINKAKQTFKEGISICPYYFDNYVFLSQVYALSSTKNSWEKALKYFERGLKNQRLVWCAIIPTYKDAIFNYYISLVNNTTNDLYKIYGIMTYAQKQFNLSLYDESIINIEKELSIH